MRNARRRILCWSIAFALGLSGWLAIYGLGGAALMIAIAAFGLCALAVASESIREQAIHGRMKDEDEE